jgi:hypothetical protein
MEKIVKSISKAKQDSLIQDMALFEYKVGEIKDGLDEQVHISFIRDEKDIAYLRELKKLEKKYFSEERELKNWPIIAMSLGAVLLLTALLVIYMVSKPNFNNWFYLILGLPALLLMSASTIYFYLRYKQVKERVDNPEEKKKKILELLETLKKDFHR